MWYCRKSHVLKKYIVYIQFILNNVMVDFDVNEEEFIS